MKRKQIWNFKNAFLFPALYAGIVSFLTIVISHSQFAVFEQMENGIYDQLQSAFSVDHRNDGLFYDWYQESFDRWGYIDVDSQFIDPSTNRVNRDSLASLLELIRERSTHSKIFLDFLFVKLPAGSQDHVQVIDSSSLRLEKAIRSLEHRLVLPYQIRQTSTSIIPICGSWTTKQFTREDNLQYLPPHSGYLALSNIEGEAEQRYEHRVFNDYSHKSAIQTLAELDNRIIKQDCPTCYEINYIIRNQPSDDLLPEALPYLPASGIIADSFLFDQSLQKKEILFIGLFSSEVTASMQPMDRFETPVSNELNGIYIVINSFLNLVTETFFKPVPKWLLFTLNFFLALASVWYFHFLRHFAVKPVWLYFAEFLVIPLFFISFILGLYLYFQTKFPIIIPSLLFLRNQFWFTAYLKYTNT